MDEPTILSYWATYAWAEDPHNFQSIMTAYGQFPYLYMSGGYECGCQVNCTLNLATRLQHNSIHQVDSDGNTVETFNETATLQPGYRAYTDASGNRVENIILYSNQLPCYHVVNQYDEIVAPRKFSLDYVTCSGGTSIGRQFENGGIFNAVEDFRSYLIPSPVNDNIYHNVSASDCGDFTHTLSWVSGASRVNISSTSGLSNVRALVPVTATASGIGDYEFDGWYLNGQLLSSGLTTTFTMPNEDVDLQLRCRELSTCHSRITFNIDIANLGHFQGPPCYWKFEYLDANNVWIVLNEGVGVLMQKPSPFADYPVIFQSNICPVYMGFNADMTSVMVFCSCYECGSNNIVEVPINVQFSESDGINVTNYSLEGYRNYYLRQILVPDPLPVAPDVFSIAGTWDRDIAVQEPEVRLYSDIDRNGGGERQFGFFGVNYANSGLINVMITVDPGEAPVNEQVALTYDTHTGQCVGRRSEGSSDWRTFTGRVHTIYATWNSIDQRFRGAYAQIDYNVSSGINVYARMNNNNLYDAAVLTYNEEDVIGSTNPVSFVRVAPSGSGINECYDIVGTPDGKQSTLIHVPTSGGFVKLKYTTNDGNNASCYTNKIGTDPVDTLTANTEYTYYPYDYQDHIMRYECQAGRNQTITTTLKFYNADGTPNEWLSIFPSIGKSNRDKEHYTPSCYGRFYMNGYNYDLHQASISYWQQNMALTFEEVYSGSNIQLTEYVGASVDELGTGDVYCDLSGDIPLLWFKSGGVGSYLPYVLYEDCEGNYVTRLYDSIAFEGDELSVFSLRCLRSDDFVTPGLD